MLAPRAVRHSIHAAERSKFTATHDPCDFRSARRRSTSRAVQSPFGYLTLCNDDLAMLDALPPGGVVCGPSRSLVEHSATMADAGRRRFARRPLIGFMLRSSIADRNRRFDSRWLGSSPAPELRSNS